MGVLPTDGESPIAAYHLNSRAADGGLGPRVVQLPCVRRAPRRHGCPGLSTLLVSALTFTMVGCGGREPTTGETVARYGYIAGGIQRSLGARWVKKIDHFEGTVGQVNGQPLAFAVDLQAPEWNHQVGVHALIARHYELVVEAGFGEQTHGLVNLGYRF